MGKTNTIESPKKRRDKGDGSLFKNNNNKWVGRFNGKFLKELSVHSRHPSWPIQSILPEPVQIRFSSPSCYIR